MTKSGSDRRVVVYSVAPLWTPHFATELELAALHHEAGDYVQIIHCRGALDSCMPNPKHELNRCIVCRSQSQRGFEALGIPTEQIAELHIESSDSGLTVPEFETLEELRAWRFDGADLGEAIASSLVSVLRDPNPDMEKQRPLVKANALTAVGLYRGAINALDRQQPDIVYVFNGRTASTRPLLRAAQNLGIFVKCHESGYELGTYRLVPNGMVHDIDANKRAMLDLWQNSDLPDAEKNRVAEGFFTGRRWGGDGDAVERYQFARNQHLYTLPSGFNVLDTNVAIVNSSEDEFAAISEYNIPIYQNQMEALESIVMDSRLQSIRFYIRVHPNLADVSNEQTRRLSNLPNLPNITVLDPNNPTDTYALMQSVDLVISFGTTAGLEAIYFGTPSVLIGRAIHEDMGFLRPTSHDDVVRMVLSNHPPPSSAAALKYGFYMRRGSHGFARFNQDSYTDGTFNGVRLRPSRKARLLGRVVLVARLLVTDRKGLWDRVRRRLGAHRQVSVAEIVEPD